MFTGIVEDTGRVAAAARRGEVVRLVVETALDLADTALGDSIAIDGVCLTVTEKGPGRVSFDVGPESLRVTALADVAPGRAVHLERALRVGDRLGGHLVQGHVDGTGTVRAREVRGDTLILVVDAPPEVTRLIIPKGSITIDGVSLTVNTLDDAGFAVWLIPHTLERTHLGQRRPGDRVNLENDVIGKYVERLLKGARPTGGLTWEHLRAHGFVDDDTGAR